MSNVPVGHERRMVVRQLDTWRQARGDQKDIPLKDVLERNSVEITPLSFVLNASERYDESIFVSIGAEIVEAVGQDLTGQAVTAVDEKSLLGHALESLPSVLEKSVPVTNSNTYENAAGETIGFRSILMPLSASSGNVDYILGVISFTKK